jgi:hypothetical protein
MRFKISELYFAQDILPEKLDKLSDKNAPSVYELDGKTVVSNGNHRIFLAMQKGEEYIDATPFRNAFPPNSKPKIISAKEWFEKQKKKLA